VSIKNVSIVKPIITSIPKLGSGVYTIVIEEIPIGTGTLLKMYQALATWIFF